LHKGEAYFRVGLQKYVITVVLNRVLYQIASKTSTSW